MKKWLIRYYLTETAYRAGIPAHSETVIGDRNYAVSFATNRLKYSQFKFFDLIEK